MKLQRETFTRTMKKNTLHVFIELAFAYPEGLSNVQIAMNIGIGQKVVGTAVSYLVSIGVAIRSGRYKVQLTPGILKEFKALLPVDNFHNAAADFFAPAAGMVKMTIPNGQNDHSPHDHDHDDDHTYGDESELILVDKSEIVDTLKKMNFGGAESFVRNNPTGLIKSWIDYYNGLPIRSKKQINSPGGFIRGKVRKGERPPVAAVKVKPDIPDEYKDIIKR